MMDNVKYSKKNTIHVKCDYKRKDLTEGRRYQIGFAFGARTGENKYTLCQAISACKDYLNDVVLAENFGYEFEAYGYSCHKQGVFDNGVHLFFSVLKESGIHCNYSEVSWSEDVVELEQRYKKMQDCLNRFESKLHLDQITTIEKVEENLYVAHLSSFWIQNPYYISLYSLMLRSLFRVTDYDNDDIIRSYQSIQTVFPNKAIGTQRLAFEDLSMIKSAFSAILCLLDKQCLPEYVPSITVEQVERKRKAGDLVNFYSLHGNGIIYCCTTLEEMLPYYQRAKKYELGHVYQ